MEIISVLYYTVDHLNDESYVDANLIPFKGSDNILPVDMTTIGIDLSEVVFNFKLNLTKYVERDFLSNNKTWPIFSKKLYNLVFQFYLPYKTIDVIVQDAKGNKIDKPYFAIQINEIRGLIDKENSEYKQSKMFPDIFSQVKKLVFNISKDTPELFRIEEYPGLLFLREKLAKNIKSANLSGVTVTPVDEYDWNY